MTQAQVTSQVSDPDGTSTGVASAGPKPARSRSQIAKANNRKGKERERNVAKYLQVNGFPGAERAVRAGYRSSSRTSPDQGDITGTPGIAWQVKDTAEREWWRIPRFMQDTQAQAKAANADFGILVVRRPGHSYPGEWWAHMYFIDLACLVAGVAQLVDVTARSLWFPVRYELQDVIPLLRAAGYGTPPEEPDDLDDETRASLMRGIADVEAGRVQDLP